MTTMSLYAAHVQKHLEMVFRKGRIGLSPGTVKINYGMPSCPPYEINASCDRFKITVPYACHSVSWDVMFYSSKPEIAPDIIFTDETFSVELEQLTTLNNWDTQDSKGFLNIICQILEIFKQHQMVQLSKYARLHFEYATIIQQDGFSENDVEVFVSPKNRGPVSFLIRLPVNFPTLPPILTAENPDEDSVLLLVTFHTPEGCRVTPQLFLSPKVEHAIGGAQEWHLPNPVIDSCLIDYVPLLMDILNVKVEQVVDRFESRKQYIITFLSHFENSVLEYDVESFSRISFLLEYNNFYFIFCIELSNNFPTDKPNFIFQSIYHKVAGKPFTLSIDYPYSPRWPIHEMFERAESFIMEHVSELELTLTPQVNIFD